MEDRQRSLPGLRVITAHTPGPWVVSDASAIERGADISTANGARDICNCYPNDARLIAAAPELLEALIETWRVIEAAGLSNLARGVQLGNTVWFVKASDAQQLSDRAIVKARGVA